MKVVKDFPITLLMIVFAITLNGQTNDAQLWADVKLEYKPNKKSSFYFQPGVRFSENISEIGMAFLEVGSGYKLNKSFELEASYRLYSKRKVEDIYSTRHKLNIDLSYKKNWYRFNFQVRTRVEMEYKDMLSSNDGLVPDFVWRNKFQAKYSLTKKMKPFAFYEVYNPLSNTYYFEVTKHKLVLGAEYKINKRNSIELYYLYEAQIHKNNPNRFFVTGISYICSF